MDSNQCEINEDASSCTTNNQLIVIRSSIFGIGMNFKKVSYFGIYRNIENNHIYIYIYMISVYRKFDTIFSVYQQFDMVTLCVFFIPNFTYTRILIYV